MLKDRLKKARLNAKLTQKQMANMLNTTQQSYAQWENGKRYPKPDSIKKLSEILNVTSDYLQGRDDGLEDIIEVLKRKTLSEDEKQKIVALLTKFIES